jgi:seryl-tRNA(Sec) selenium transferase
MRSSYTTTTTRNSEDIAINERGKRLLDLVAESGKKLLNGSTLGDVFGRFTYVTLRKTSKRSMRI